tara:strand:+ start:342 stop:629 length:288 start_codon:yes stop_codon:yes gene_type:complete
MPGELSFLQITLDLYAFLVLYLGEMGNTTKTNKTKESKVNNQIKKNNTIIKNRPLNEYGTNPGDKVYIRKCDRMCANKVDAKLAAEYYSILGWEY